MKKCREIAVMKASDGGVTTRARAALAMAAAKAGTAKKRKVNNSKLKRALIRPENSVSAAIDGGDLRRRTAIDDLRSSTSSDRVLASCCSSDESCIKLVDLQQDECDETSTYRCRRQRREMTPSSEIRSESEDLESTVKQSKTDSRRNSTAEKMPTESEIEEFFSSAEEQIQKNFAEKYNYDIFNDKPLEGRYEWIPLKP